MCPSIHRRSAVALVGNSLHCLARARGRVRYPSSNNAACLGDSRVCSVSQHGAQLGLPSLVQLRGKKTTTSMKLDDLPQPPLKVEASSPGATQRQVEAVSSKDSEDVAPAYPTVVMQAWRTMRKFDNCVLLTRVGGFYELYLTHAEEYGPLLNLKVAQKKTSAGPVPMAGFPFFQLDRFLKILVQELNCHVAIAEEFPNDPGDKVKSNGLMHDRRVTRVITPGTLIDENFMDPYANNYVMSIHVEEEAAADAANASQVAVNLSSAGDAADEAQAPTLGLAWIDISTGQFYTQATTITALSSILSRIGPREVVVDQALQLQRDHALFDILTEDKHLITYSPHTEPLSLPQWTPMLESEVPQQTVGAFTSQEVNAGSLLLQYVRDRLLGLSMKLFPPVRHGALQILTIDKNSMRSLEVKQTIRDGASRGSLLHSIRKTVTKSGARLLNEWLSAPSTSLETITQRQDMVAYFIENPDLRDMIVQLLRRSHDSQRLVQKFAFGRGDPDDLVGLSSTIRATEDIVRLLAEAQAEAEIPSPFLTLISRINLDESSKLAAAIDTAIDEDGISQKHQLEDSEAGLLQGLAEETVSSEGTVQDAALLPKSPKTKKKASGATTSIRDHYSDDNLSFIMKPDASKGLRSLHDKLDALLDEKTSLGETLRERLGAQSLTLRWTPNLGHICHVKGKDAKAASSSLDGVHTVASSRSTRSFHLPEWTALGQRIHQTRFQMQTEESRIFSELRAQVVLNLVKLRRNAAVLDELDITTSFASLASERGLIRPVMNNGTATVIVGGRHPTVEGGLREQGRTFTSNDCLVGSGGEGRLWLITGPNMAGKSTYLRQNALITILAQVGCYVPAGHAELGIVDAIFTRVGSADNLYRDQSTFMVEMLETAQILRSATARSFVIMDEIGRGTTPEDGAAVAFASLWHLVTVNRCRALFATHFHGLAGMVLERGMHVSQQQQQQQKKGGSVGGVEMYCTDVKEDEDGGFLYVHRLRKGINNQSHALKVAGLAGLPEAAINVAKEVLRLGSNGHQEAGGQDRQGAHDTPPQGDTAGAAA